MCLCVLVMLNFWRRQIHDDISTMSWKKGDGCVLTLKVIMLEQNNDVSFTIVTFIFILFQRPDNKFSFHKVKVQMETKCTLSILVQIYGVAVQFGLCCTFQVVSMKIMSWNLNLEFFLCFFFFSLSDDITVPIMTWKKLLTFWNTGVNSYSNYISHLTSFKGDGRNLNLQLHWSSCTCITHKPFSNISKNQIARNEECDAAIRAEGVLGLFSQINL